ncbi:MAG: hypothetical protein ACREIY_00435 [Candidatus Rokuibacteriota bacterium]
MPPRGKVFATMECFACHDVKGEDFPRDSDRGDMHHGDHQTGGSMKTK